MLSVSLLSFRQHHETNGLFLLLLLSVLPWMMAFADEAVHEEGHVLVLDSSNFTEVVTEHPFIVVEFYAPW